STAADLDPARSTVTEPCTSVTSAAGTFGSAWPASTAWSNIIANIRTSDPARGRRPRHPTASRYTRSGSSIPLTRTAPPSAATPPPPAPPPGPPPDGAGADDHLGSHPLVRPLQPGRRVYHVADCRVAQSARAPARPDHHRPAVHPHPDPQPALRRPRPG